MRRQTLEWAPSLNHATSIEFPNGSQPHKKFNLRRGADLPYVGKRGEQIRRETRMKMGREGFARENARLFRLPSSPIQPCARQSDWL